MQQLAAGCAATVNRPASINVMRCMRVWCPWVAAAAADDRRQAAAGGGAGAGILINEQPLALRVGRPRDGSCLQLWGRVVAFVGQQIQESQLGVSPPRQVGLSGL